MLKMSCLHVWLQTVMSTLEMLDALDEEKTGEFIPQDFQIVKLLGKLAMQVSRLLKISSDSLCSLACGHVE